MDRKKADPKAVPEVAGDPGFYNDQIGNNNEPMKKNMDEKYGAASKNEWPSQHKLAENPQPGMSGYDGSERKARIKHPKNIM